MENRFKNMSLAIWELLDSYQPNIIYIEETYAARNPQTTKILTRLQGVIYAWCMNHDCEFNTISPASWRRQLSFKQNRNIKRDALKKQSVKYILEHYSLGVSDDEADAICIADAVLKMCGEQL